MKAAYIWASTVGQMFVLLMAVITPVYFTPGLYWWTWFFLFMSVSGSYAFGKRMDMWVGKL